MSRYDDEFGGQKGDPIFYDPNFSIETPDDHYQPEWIVIYMLFAVAIVVFGLAIFL